GNVVAEVADQQPRVDVIGRAGAGETDHRQLAALVELLGRLRAGDGRAADKQSGGGCNRRLQARNIVHRLLPGRGPSSSPAHAIISRLGLRDCPVCGLRPTSRLSRKDCPETKLVLPIRLAFGTTLILPRWFIVQTYHVSYGMDEAPFAAPAIGRPRNSR